MTVVYLICGYSGAGKDTVGAHISERRGSTHYAFADGVREVAKLFGDNYEVDSQTDLTYNDAIESYGYEAAKRGVEGVRDYLVRIGHGLRQVLGDDVWVSLRLALLVGELTYRRSTESSTRSTRMPCSQNR